MVNYKKLYDKIGSIRGWDFSEISKHVKEIGRKWDYPEVVKKYIDEETVLLDIGTGGGKKLLNMSKYVKKAYGIDILESMVKTANENLKQSKISNTEFCLADSKELPFENDKFDVVTAKHAPFYPKEVSRVLKSKGIFITQQVGENDRHNIKKVFGRGQSYGEEAGSQMREYVKRLEEEGFNILRKETNDFKVYYENMETLIFLLKNTPSIPDFDVKKDQKYLEEIEDKYRTEKGIESNTHRYLIIAKND